jgi:hypothetical protein
LKLRLTEVSWNCIHFTEAPPGPLGLAGRNVSVLRTDISDVDESQLLERLKDAFRFPYFGHNWDALHDALMDLEWLDSRMYILILDGATSFWTRHPRDAGRLVEIWLGCAEYWARSGVPFHLVFVM